MISIHSAKSTNGCDLVNTAYYILYKFYRDYCNLYYLCVNHHNHLMFLIILYKFHYCQYIIRSLFSMARSLLGKM